MFRIGKRRKIGSIVIVQAERPHETTGTRTTGPGMSGFGMVVGRKVGNAVERNRVRRRIRHAFHAVGGCPGYDVVVIGRREVLTVDWVELVGWIAEAVGAPKSTGRVVEDDDGPGEGPGEGPGNGPGNEKSK